MLFADRTAPWHATNPMMIGSFVDVPSDMLQSSFCSAVNSISGKLLNLTSDAVILELVRIDLNM